MDYSLYLESSLSSHLQGKDNDYFGQVMEKHKADAAYIYSDQPAYETLPHTCSLIKEFAVGPENYSRLSLKLCPDWTGRSGDLGVVSLHMP